MEKKYFIRIAEQLVEVNKEIYTLHHQTKRRAQYLEERDLINGLVYYSSLDTEDTTGEDGIPDKTSLTVEEVVIQNIMIEKLNKSLVLLNQSEMDLINALFYAGYSEREWASKTGIPQKTINDRKRRILDKLKNLLEK